LAALLRLVLPLPRLSLLVTTDRAAPSVTATFLPRRTTPAPLLWQRLDPNHRIGAPDTQKTFLRLLEHLDINLIARFDTKFRKGGLDRHFNGRSLDFNPLHSYFLLRRLRFFSETG
jgi:hypothetical protein